MMTFVVATILLLFLRITTSDADNTLCENLPPGLDRLALGVDISCLEYEPSDFTKPDGYRGKVIDFTCNKVVFYLVLIRNEKILNINNQKFSFILLN